jgi:EPS-associated MarR family transcriptional regulator
MRVQEQKWTPDQVRGDEQPPMRSTESALQGGSVPKHMPQNTQEIHLKVLRHIEENPEVTQRELASELGVSLGKANYCLKALMDKGFIKARNFHNSNNKRAYLYKLTPMGIEAKARISVAFLRRKMDEYEQLKEEIEQLQTEVNGEL